MIGVHAGMKGCVQKDRKRLAYVAGVDGQGKYAKLIALGEIGNHVMTRNNQISMNLTIDGSR